MLNVVLRFDDPLRSTYSKVWSVLRIGVSGRRPPKFLIPAKGSACRPPRFLKSPTNRKFFFAACGGVSSQKHFSAQRGPAPRENRECCDARRPWSRNLANRLAPRPLLWRRYQGEQKVSQVKGVVTLGHNNSQPFKNETVPRVSKVNNHCTTMVTHRTPPHN